jgi:hypothetical protein
MEFIIEPSSLQFENNGNPLTQNYVYINAESDWTAEIEFGNDINNMIANFTNSGIGSENLYINVNDGSDFVDVSFAIITITCGETIKYLNLCRQGTMFVCY